MYVVPVDAKQHLKADTASKIMKLFAASAYVEANIGR